MIKRFCSLAVLAAFVVGAAPVTAQTTPPAGQAPPAQAPAGQVPPAQVTASTITGVVRDSSGGVIRGAEVIAIPVTGTEARTLTGEDGRFTVTPDGTGIVVLFVHPAGFAEARQTIAVGANRLDLELVVAPAGLEETVGVTGRMPPPPPPPPPPKPPKPPKPPAPPLQPVVNRWYAGLTTAVASGNSGGALGGEAGLRFRRSLDVFLQGGWFNNVVTAHQRDSAAPLLSYLQATTGEVAAASLKRQAFPVTVGARRVFEGVRLPALLRPYAQAGVGFARVEGKSKFTLGGTDVTSTLDQYGVVLGVDTAGTEHRVAATVGFGVLRPIGSLYVDVAYRLTYIGSDLNPAKVNGLHIGVGKRF